MDGLCQQFLLVAVVELREGEGALLLHEVAHVAPPTTFRGDTRLRALRDSETTGYEPFASMGTTGYEPFERAGGTRQALCTAAI